MKTLRVVVVGAGAGIFSAHRRGLRAIEAQVAGVYDVNAERARTVAEEFGCPLYHDVASLLAEEADLAVILAPHPFHAELAIASMQSGKHVLVEKPIAVQVAEADQMLAEARNLGRLLAVAFQQRTRGEVQEARRLIQQGVLGAVQRADVLGAWPRRATYFQVAPWRGTWRGEGGGVLINQGQHDLDLLCYLVGRPSKVVGWTRTQRHPIETEDTVQAMVEWPNGALGSIHLSTAEVDVAQRIEIIGTAGRLRVLPGCLEFTRNAVDFREHTAGPGNPYEAPTTEEMLPFHGEAGGHEHVYRNLVRAVNGDEPLIAPGDEAIVSLELANAIIYSSQLGEEVHLPLNRAAYGRLLDSLRQTSEPTRGTAPR